MIPLLFTEGKDFTKEERDSLWKQGVNLDDWDYMILAPVSVLSEEDRVAEWSDEPYKDYYCANWQIDRMLAGSSHNRWYKATFRGQEYAIGVAYHS